MLRHRFAAPLLLAALPACEAETLAQEWQLDRLRILAARATPAEPQPGEPTALEALVYTPAGVQLAGVLWFACLPQGSDDFGCTVDPELLEGLQGLDPATASPEELQEALAAAQEAGFVGFDPFLPPVWVPPLDALDGLSEAEAQEGVSALVNITALPPDGEDVDAVELAFKRVPVSRALTPNQNPDVTAIEVDGTSTAEGLGLPEAPIPVEAGREIVLNTVISDGSVETYTYTSSSGATEERQEEPYFAWYAEGGEFYQTISLYPYTEVRWTAPEKPGWTGLLAVVMRDRRGGMAWRTVHVVVE
jgi:hypothetical protein